MSDICPYCKSEYTGNVRFKEYGCVIRCRKCGKDWFEEMVWVRDRGGVNNIIKDGRISEVKR